MRYVPSYRYICAGQEIELANGKSDFVATKITGEDSLDIDMSEAQSVGQAGTSITSAMVGSRKITITGAIIHDVFRAERRLKEAVRPFAPAVLYKTDADGVVWYLEGQAERTAELTWRGQDAILFQFSFRAPYPFWRTAGRTDTVIGGLQSTWFPTPVSTAGSWYISQYSESRDTVVTNGGNVAAEFELKLIAAAEVKNPALHNLHTGGYIKLNKTMLTGEVAIVSTITGQRGCRYFSAAGVESNGFGLIDIDSDMAMTIRPGGTKMRLLTDSGRENLTAIVLAPKGVMSSV